MKVTQTQSNIINANKRFKVICAGRRWGKTYLALIWLLKNAYSNPDNKCWFVSPSYRMSKNIAWQILKNLVFERPEYLRKINESSLEITLSNGSMICLKGADNYDSLRGTGINFVVLDEFAFMDKEVWTEVIRPSLTDTKGQAMFIGTPDGFNYFYEVFNAEKTDSDYRSWKFKTIESPFIDKIEIVKARQELDIKTFRQEYEASFETAQGLVYYCFDRNKHIKKLESYQNLPICLTFDFNFSESPMTTSICQIENNKLNVLECLSNKTDLHTHCINLIERLKDYQFNGINIYGDASKVHSIESNMTNWQIVKQFFPAALYKVPSSNPAVLDRINSVNARLMNANGEIFLYLNESKTIELMKDFEQVTYIEGKRDINKKDLLRTHYSDNIGYLVWQEWSLKPKPLSKQF